MPRGVKAPPKPIQEQIAEIDGKIEGFQAKISELKTAKKALQEAERKEALDKILDTMKEKGLSVEDAIKKLAK